MSLASCIRDLDTVSLEEIIFSDMSLDDHYVTGVDPNQFPHDRDISNHVKPTEPVNCSGNSGQRQTSREYCVRLLTRLFRFRGRPPHDDENLQRMSSNASVASYSSQRLHEVLRADENMVAFPEFRSNQTFFQRKSPLQGRYRSLKGKTLEAVRRTTWDH